MSKPAQRVSAAAICDALPVGLTQLPPLQDVEFSNVDAVNMFWTLLDGRVLAESLKFRNVTTAHGVWDNDGVHTARTPYYAQTPSGEGALVQPYLEFPTQPSPLNTPLTTETPPLTLDDEWITTLNQVLSTLPDKT